MTDLTTAALITAGSTLLNGIMVGGFAIVVARTNREQVRVQKAAVEVQREAVAVQQDAAVKVEAVRVNLQQTQEAVVQKLDGLVAVSDKIHVLSNNKMAVQLEKNATSTARLAKITGSEEDIEAAHAAARDWAEHQGLQRSVDAAQAVIDADHRIAIASKAVAQAEQDRKLAQNNVTRIELEKPQPKPPEREPEGD